MSKDNETKLSDREDGYFDNYFLIVFHSTRFESFCWTGNLSRWSVMAPTGVDVVVVVVGVVGVVSVVVGVSVACLAEVCP